MCVFGFFFKPEQSLPSVLELGLSTLQKAIPSVSVSMLHPCKCHPFIEAEMLHFMHAPWYLCSLADKCPSSLVLPRHTQYILIHTESSQGNSVHFTVGQKGWKLNIFFFAALCGTRMFLMCVLFCHVHTELGFSLKAHIFLGFPLQHGVIQLVWLAVPFWSGGSFSTWDVVLSDVQVWRGLW